MSLQGNIAVESAAKEILGIIDAEIRKVHPHRPSQYAMMPLSNKIDCWCPMCISLRRVRAKVDEIRETAALGYY